MKQTIIIVMALAAAVPASADLVTDVILPSNCELEAIKTAEFLSGAKYAAFNTYSGEGTFFFYDQGYLGNTTSPGLIRKVTVGMHSDNGGDIGLYVYNEPMITDDGIPVGEYLTDLSADVLEYEITGDYKYVAVISNTMFSYDLDSLSFTWEVNGGVGVESIEAKDGEAVYFNLQGLRVDNPEKGVFIRIQNGKSTKIAL